MNWAAAPAVDSDLWMAETHSGESSGIFFTDGESRALRQGPLRPCSELSRSCLNGFLIVFVLLFSSSLLLLFSVCWFVFPLDCVLSWHLTHCCQTGFFLKNHRSKGDVVPGTFVWQSDVCGGKQESSKVNAPSGRFSSIHQLPRFAPKIEKSSIFLSAEPQLALFGACVQKSFP